MVPGFSFYYIWVQISLFMFMVKFFIHFLGIAFIFLLCSTTRLVDLTVLVAFQFCCQSK